jgi:hypothetical protein
MAAFGLAGQNTVAHVEFASVRRPGELSHLVGVDVRGFKHAVSNQAMAHTIAKHGVLSEATRGQKVVTPADFAKLPQIVGSGRYQPAEPRKFGPPRVQVVAEVEGDRFYYVGEVRRAKKRIDMITMWKR